MCGSLVNAVRGDLKKIAVRGNRQNAVGGANLLAVRGSKPAVRGNATAVRGVERLAVRGSLTAVRGVDLELTVWGSWRVSHKTSAVPARLREVL